MVIESLAEEFDVVEIASAAVKLAYEATTDGREEEEIPAAPLPRERPAPGRGAPAQGSRRRGAPDGRRADHDVARILVGAGRRTGLRPQDLVGAIANEAGIDGHAIGAIELADQFSLVEVPAPLADRIVNVLRGARLKGKRVIVRRGLSGPALESAAGLSHHTTAPSAQVSS